MVKNNNRPDRGKNRKAGNVTLSAEEESTLLAKQLKLKPKSKAVLDEILNNPKISKTEAYMKVHSTNNRNTARAAVAKLTAKPSAKIYSDRAVGKAKRRIVELVDSSNESIAVKASQDILDRTEGKAIQRSENLNRTVEVKLDLSGARIGSHYMQPAPEVPLIEE